MSDELELSISELRRKKRSDSVQSNGHSTDQQENGHSPAQIKDPPFRRNHNYEGETWIEPEPTPRTEQTEPEPRATAIVPIPPAGDEDAIKLPFDPIRLVEAVRRKWLWCVLAGIVFGALGLTY